MGRSRKQPITRGIPALVLVPTGEVITIHGKRYTVLRLQYDLHEEYLPAAMPMY